MAVDTPNASQVYFISQVLLQNEQFNHYKPVLQRMAALIGPPVTSNTITIMYFVAATYSLLKDRSTSVLRAEQVRQQWINDRIWKLFCESC